jgi:2-polyprenyl-6-methoxyphenol hydroxylase-like FAD-dependent oxidoreductase
MQHIGGHAVVLGASMAGLLAARALHPYFARVTLIERDSFPAVVAPRKGVPQSAHAHALLAGGREALEQLFPGFTGQLLERGAMTRDLVDRGRWVINGCRLATAPSQREGLMVSRPLLETHTRTRVLALANVRAIEGCSVLGLVGSAARVRGVRLRRAGAEIETLDADLLVDATGRGSRLPTWLSELGADVPREQRVCIGLSYATRTFRRKPHDLNGDLSALCSAAPPNVRCGVALAIEGDRWLVTLAGYFHERIPTDHAGFVRYARGLAAPDIHELIGRAEPLDEGTIATFPHSQRRFYEQLRKHPEGLIAVGDSICSFNPTFGQGMSVAALEACRLEEEVARGVPGLPRRFYAAAAPVIDVPWQIAVGADLAFPQVDAPRPLASRWVGRYMRRLQRAAVRDARVSLAFLRVSNLLAPPATLFAPSLVGLVLKLGGRSRERPAVPLPVDASVRVDTDYSG